MNTTMPTSTPIPSSPSSYTRAAWPADPAPLHWPLSHIECSRYVLDAQRSAATKRSRDLMATRRALADEATVRRMVAECTAMVEGVST